MINIFYIVFYLLNNNLKLCKNCIYLKPYYIKDGIYNLDECIKFKVNNSEKIIYKYADECRRDENKCGKNGTHFLEKVTLLNK